MVIPLSANTLVPRKRFGQHFLCDQGVIQQIMAAFAPQVDEHVIEIGPGQGALTVPLLQRLKKIEVIELDRDLIPTLQVRARQLGELQVYAQDALKVNFTELKNDKRLLRVIGNLPYNISTPLLFHLLDHASVIQDMLFMLQKEVAERLAAPVSSAAYGRLSVMIQYHCETQLLFDVPPNAFFPPPQVRSSMIRLVPYRSYPHGAKNYALFSELVKQAFNQRRKTIRNSLKKMVSDNVWEEVSLHSDLRPENLSVADFVMLSNKIL